MTPCYLPQTEIPTENFLFPIQLEFDYAKGLQPPPDLVFP